jgi:hypothetical protein
MFSRVVFPVAFAFIGHSMANDSVGKFWAKKESESFDIGALSCEFFVLFDKHAKLIEKDDNYAPMKHFDNLSRIFFIMGYAYSRGYGCTFVEENLKLISRESMDICKDGNMDAPYFHILQVAFGKVDRDYQLFNNYVQENRAEFHDPERFLNWAEGDLDVVSRESDDGSVTIEWLSKDGVTGDPPIESYP